MKLPPGLHRRQNGTWWYRHYADGTKLGRRPQVSLPATTSADEAVREYFKARAEAARRRESGAPKRLTFEEAADEYLKVQQNRLAPGTVRNLQRMAKLLKAAFGKRRVEHLRPSDVADYQAKRRAEGVMASTVNEETTTLLAIVRKMVVFRWVERDPLPRGAVETLPTPAPATDFFRPDEWADFLAGVAARRQDAVPAFRGLLLTGCRVGELVRLTWAGVDFDAGRVTFAMSKRRGKPKTLPLQGELKDFLSSLDRGTPAAPVFRRASGFPWTEKALGDVLRKVRTATSLRTSISVHTVRHTFASWQAQAGVPIVNIMTSLGHSDIRQTMRYAHLCPEHLTGGMDAVSKAEKSGRRHSGATSEAKS